MDIWTSSFLYGESMTVRSAVNHLPFSGQMLVLENQQ